MTAGTQPSGPGPPAAAAAPLSALLLLADGRFPAGAHAHSGGLEAAAALEGVHDVPGLEAFLRGRVSTVGAVAAAFAAASCTALHTRCESDTDPNAEPARPPEAAPGAVVGVAGLGELHVELEARTPSPALRAASLRLGRQLLRSARRVWPHHVLDELATLLPRGAHQPVALGAVAAAAGLEPHAAALSAVHDAVVGPATAAVRLLGLDPVAVHETLARLGDPIDEVAAAGAGHAHTPPGELPGWAAPLMDISAERHATWEVRLFAS